MSHIETLLEIMAALRDPEGGCPWDREQDFRSIVPYTIEEAYEVADAIDRNDMAGLREELGDLLLQVVFHARMAEELGEFEFNDVVEAIAGKLIRRHPHVFGDREIASAADQHRAWETFKAEEEGRESGAKRALSGVAMALPALARAAKLGRRAARVGFDWPDAAGVADKVREEMHEVEAAIGPGGAHLAEEIGDLLFSVANLARHADIDPEEALRLANVKFERRFEKVEDLVRGSGKGWRDLGPADLDAMWQRVKCDE